jgi:hypothetical protein
MLNHKFIQKEIIILKFVSLKRCVIYFGDDCLMAFSFFDHNEFSSACSFNGNQLHMVIVLKALVYRH